MREGVLLESPETQMLVNVPCCQPQVLCRNPRIVTKPVWAKTLTIYPRRIVLAPILHTVQIARYTTCGAMPHTDGELVVSMLPPRPPTVAAND